MNGLYLAAAGDQQAHSLGLSEDFYQVTRPRFTDDEQAVTFSTRLKSEGQGNRSLWQINLDGSDLQRLSPDDGNDYGPGTAGTDETITTQGYGECLIAFAASGNSLSGGYVPPYIPPGCNGWHVYPGSVVIIHHDGRPPTTLHTTTPAFAVDVPRHRKTSKRTRHRRFLKFIKTYQPIVHGDPDDGFLPMPFPAVLKYRGSVHGRTCITLKSVTPDTPGVCKTARLAELTKNGPTTPASTTRRTSRSPINSGSRIRRATVIRAASTVRWSTSTLPGTRSTPRSWCSTGSSTATTIGT